MNLIFYLFIYRFTSIKNIYSVYSGAPAATKDKVGMLLDECAVCVCRDSNCSLVIEA